jgi:multicomponent Na+:H+ antiporter subunit E
MRKVKAFILSTLILMALWLILSGTNADALIVGILVSVGVALLFLPHLEILADIRFSPKALAAIFIYGFVFLFELFKSAIDVAGRVLSPRLPINPGIVKVRTRLKSRIGRIVLANSITLTPGTMTVETSGEYLYIHWIDIKTDDVESATNEIVRTFERHLEVIFG